MAGEREGKRKRQAKKKPGAISPVSVSEEGEKRGGEQVCVHRKETTHTCTHTPKGWGHSQNAAEVQQSCRPCRSTLFCLPYTQNTKTTPPNSRTRRNHRPPCKYKPCKRGGLCASVDLEGWEWVNSTMTASGEPASSRTCTNPSLSLSVSEPRSLAEKRGGGGVKGKLFLWFHA